ncbi:DUF4142 domain-containing protein [Spirosoma jeollabukense]
MKSIETTPRRDFFKKTVTGTLALSAGMPLMASLLPSLTAQAAIPLEDSPTAANEKEFRQGVIGPAELSLVTSQIAVSKATNKYAKEFAGFELEEAKAVTSVLKDLGTPVPAMNAKAQATLTKIKTTTGAAFDKAYIQAQLENHEFLRDLAQDYLKNSMGKTSPAESQTRHLATLALAVFKEHVALTKQILGQLGG